MTNKEIKPKENTSLDHVSISKRKGKTPAEISKLRFADIACGSGSFLIGVFDCLLKYHTGYYNRNPEQARKDGCIEKDGEWILSIKQKQSILKNNIYGVDIDHQAVEVTQLSLALKMLEDETLATANEMQVLFHEKILPDLTKNIVCGNSLIGTDILHGRMFASEEERKLNPMDFETVFPNIFNHSLPSVIPSNDSSSATPANDPNPVIPAKAGIQNNYGFDAIVGNPPYVRQESIQNIKEYLNKNYAQVSDSTADLYVYFIYKCIKLLNSNGKFGYIISNKFTRAKYGYKLRNFIKNNVSIVEYIDKFENKVFKDAAVDPCILIIENKNGNNNKIKYENEYISQNSLKDESWTFASNHVLNLKSKIENIGKKIKEYEKVKIYRGIVTGLNEAFVINEQIKNKLILEDENISEYVKLMTKGRNLKRYCHSGSNEYLLLLKPNSNANNVLLNYLLKYKNLLSQRWEPKHGKIKWWELRPCVYYDMFETSKIIYPDISENGGFYWDEDKFYFNNTIYMICNAPKYWTALLNSKLLTWYYKQIASNLGEKGVRYFTQFVEQIPIIDNIQNPDILTSYVTQMLESKKQLLESKTESDRKYYDRKCENLDRAIDSEVYKLYGLTDDEIKIVESKE